MKGTFDQPSPEFCFNADTGHHHSHLREILIRTVGIIIISVSSVFLDFGFIRDAGNMTIALIISFVRTTLLWNGSMYIIQFIVVRYASMKNMGRVVLIMATVLAVFVIAVEWGEIMASAHFLGVRLSPEQRQSQMVVAILITFMISAIYSSVAFFMQWKENLQKTQELERANLEAKYETLRNQVNPHFLFNSLNTLLSIVNDNPTASQYVESISDIMRYMIRSNERETVTLKEELDIAGEYAFIQQKRFEGKLSVEINVEPEFFDQSIPPLTLQMLLENAIKHNVISADNHLRITVFIADRKYIAVENNLMEKPEKELSTGIGLVNIRARYIHLSGEEIIVKKESGKFTVLLPLFKKSLES